MKIAPRGTDNIITMMCGTCSNENAMKLMCMKYAEKLRGGRVDFTPEELHSAMTGEMPGIPKMCVISFHGSFHGRTIGCLSVTHSKPIHLVDIPLMGWPVCSYPRYLYPLEEHTEHNRKQDERCLAEVEDTIVKQLAAGCPAAGIIAEPVQGAERDGQGCGAERGASTHRRAACSDATPRGARSAPLSPYVCAVTQRQRPYVTP